MSAQLICETECLLSVGRQLPARESRAIYSEKTRVTSGGIWKTLSMTVFTVQPKYRAPGMLLFFSDEKRKTRRTSPSYSTEVTIHQLHNHWLGTKFLIIWGITEVSSLCIFVFLTSPWWLPPSIITCRVSSFECYWEFSSSRSLRGQAGLCTELHVCFCHTFHSTAPVSPFRTHVHSTSVLNPKTTKNHWFFSVKWWQTLGSGLEKGSQQRKAVWALVKERGGREERGPVITSQDLGHLSNVDVRSLCTSKP